jgi:hypothetical protein
MCTQTVRQISVSGIGYAVEIALRRVNAGAVHRVQVTRDVGLGRAGSSTISETLRSPSQIACRMNAHGLDNSAKYATRSTRRFVHHRLSWRLAAQMLISGRDGGLRGSDARIDVSLQNRAHTRI